jgi:hypothetical protein
MTKFKAVANAVTGKTDYNFPAILRSVGQKFFEYTNAKGEKGRYVLGTVDFTYPNGAPAVGVTTQIFEKNLAHGVKVGDSLLSTLSRGDDNTLWIRTSHLVAGNNVDIDAFGSLFEEVAPAVAVDAQA